MSLISSWEKANNIYGIASCMEAVEIWRKSKLDGIWNCLKYNQNGLFETEYMEVEYDTEESHNTSKWFSTA